MINKYHAPVKVETTLSLLTVKWNRKISCVLNYGWE